MPQQNKSLFFPNLEIPFFRYAIFCSCILFLFLRCSKVHEQEILQNKKLADHFIAIGDSLFAKYSYSSPDTILEYGKKALQQSESIGYLSGIEKSLALLGKIYLNKSEYDSASRIFKKAIQLIEDGNNFDTPYLFYKGMGKVYINIDRYDSSIRMYAKATELVDESDTICIFPRIKNNIATCYKRLGVLPRAIEIYHESLKNARLCGDSLMISICLTNIGIVYRNLQEWESAINCYDEALLISERIQDTIGVALIYINLGSLYSDQKEALKSLYHSTLAKQTMENGGLMNRNYSALLNNIGLEYQKIGSMDSSQIYFENSLHHSTGIGDSSGIADALINLGYLAIKNGDMPEAEELISKGIDVANRTKVIDFEIQGYKAMLDYFKLQGDFEGALSAQKKYYELYFKVYNQNQKKEAELTAMRYNHEQAVLQNAHLQQNILILEESHRSRQFFWILILTLFLSVILLLIIFYQVKKRKADLSSQRRSLLYAQLMKSKKKLLSETTKLSYKIGVNKEVIDFLNSNLSNFLPENRLLITRMITKLNESNEERWEEFDSAFVEVHESFFKNLKQNHPSLTSDNLRFCALLKAGYTNMEISKIRNVQDTSTQKYINRLKNIMRLGTQTDLRGYLDSL